MIPAFGELVNNTTPLIPFLDLYDTRSAIHQTITPGGAATLAASHRPTLYAGFVVSLYGALEKFVEDLAEWTVDKIVSLQMAGKENRLLDQVFREHYNRSLECLNKSEDPRFGGSLDLSTVLSEMRANRDRDLTKITGTVFRTHSSNLRLHSIEKMLKPLGIDVCADLDRSGIQALENMATIDKRRRLETILMNLANARNDASHGKLTNLVSVEDLRTWLNTVSQLARWIARLATSLVAECLVFSLPGHGLIATESFSNGDVLVISGSSSDDVSEGDIIVSRRGVSPAFIWAPINSLKVDGQRQNRAPLNHPKKIGVKTNVSRDKDHEHWTVRQLDWARVGLPLEGPAAL